MALMVFTSAQYLTTTDVSAASSPPQDVFSMPTQLSFSRIKYNFLKPKQRIFYVKPPKALSTSSKPKKDIYPHYKNEITNTMHSNV